MLDQFRNLCHRIKGVELERYLVRDWAKPLLNEYRQKLNHFHTQTKAESYQVQNNVLSIDISSNNNQHYKMQITLFPDETYHIKIINEHQKYQQFNLDELIGKISLQQDETQQIMITDINGDVIAKYGTVEISFKLKGEMKLDFMINFHPIYSLRPYFKNDSPCLLINYYMSPHLAGLPSHAESLLLKDTVKDKPYQMYNQDRFLWPVNSRGSMYGSNPLLFNFGAKGQNVIFWRNTSETYVDIHSLKHQREVNFMSECNDFEIYGVFNEGSFKGLYQRLIPIIGTCFLPTYWSLAHQHSRYSFMSREDILAVDAGYDKHNIPIDAFYLDLHHTDEGMKYFTWNPKTYPDPESLLKHFEDKHRFIVTIQDPHFGIAKGYSIYEAFAPKDLVVQRNGKPFVAKAWPGLSHYVDFIDEDARQLWADQYDYLRYKYSNRVSVWNDLNEPTCQDFPEDIECMPKDCVHRLKLKDGNKVELEHRQVRLAYGMLQMQATCAGLRARDKNELRNIAFTRGFFTGIQKYAIVWTADAESTFKYLQATTPILLAFALAGMSFNGGDIPGFQYWPTEELCRRWYQLGAFQPFFRSHSNIDTERREPWLFSKKTLDNIKQNVRYRYELLPYWYSQFYDNHDTGYPVLRPLWMEFPKVEECYHETQIHIVGDALVVIPVVSEYQTHTNFEIAEKLNVPLYDYWTEIPLVKQNLKHLKVLEDRVQVYALGGRVVPCFDAADALYTTSHDLLHLFNYHLKIYLDQQGKASGYLFIDDGITYRYEQGEFIHLHFSYDNYQLDIKRVGGNVVQDMTTSPIYNKLITKITVHDLNHLRPFIYTDLSISTLLPEQKIILQNFISPVVNQFKE